MIIKRQSKKISIGFILLSGFVAAGAESSHLSSSGAGGATYSSLPQLESKASNIEPQNRVKSDPYSRLTELKSSHFNEESYKLQPGDVLQVQILQEEKVDTVVPVGNDGNISVPFAGILRAEGRTTFEIQNDLKARFIQTLRLRDPQVAVVIRQYRKIQASVVGVVGTPGVHELRPGDTLLTLLSAAGGTNELGQAELHRATLRHRGSQESIPIDVRALLDGDASQNFVVEDGDELTIPPEINNKINVIGSVVSPGNYPYREGMRVADAIAIAGGRVRYQTKLSDVHVIRPKVGRPNENDYIPVNIARYYKSRDSKDNIILEPGDTVHIPYSKTPDLNRFAQITNTLLILTRLAGY